MKEYTEEDLRQAFYKGREQACLPDENGTIMFIRPTFNGYLRELEGGENPYENWKLRCDSLINDKEYDLLSWKTMYALREIQRETLGGGKETSNKKELQRIANMFMDIDHMGVQSDNIHKCEQQHQAILAADKLDKHEAIRLLSHIIHVQQLQLVNAKIEYDEMSPFRDMVNFNYIDRVVKYNSPNTDTLY